MFTVIPSLPVSHAPPPNPSTDQPQPSSPSTAAPRTSSGSTTNEPQPPSQPFRTPSQFAIAMTPSFPPNGSPFRQPAAPYTHPSPGQTNGSPQAMPSHIPPQYPYVMAPGPYAPYHYPQYPQQLMYMPPPRPVDSAQGSPPVQSPASSQPANGKRKRKSVNGQDGDASDGDAPGPSPEPPRPSPLTITTGMHEIKKRTKTQRACDSCRSRKIRFVSLSSLDRPTRPTFRAFVCPSDSSHERLFPRFCSLLICT